MKIKYPFQSTYVFTHCRESKMNSNSHAKNVIDYFHKSFELSMWNICLSIVFPPTQTRWKISFWRTYTWNRTKERIATAKKAKLCRHCENQRELKPPTFISLRDEWASTLWYAKTVINFFITIKLIKFQRQDEKKEENLGFIYFYFFIRLDKIFSFSPSLKIKNAFFSLQMKN